MSGLKEWLHACTLLAALLGGWLVGFGCIARGLLVPNLLAFRVQ
jgi:hypothetical protein